MRTEVAKRPRRCEIFQSEVTWRGSSGAARRGQRSGQVLGATEPCVRVFVGLVWCPQPPATLGQSAGIGMSCKKLPQTALGPIKRVLPD